jgi:hypothetical protein
VGPLNLLETLRDPDAAAVRRFLEEWHGPRRPEYGLPPEDLPADLPSPLKDFYLFAGRWPHVVVQNHLAAPREVEQIDGHLVFYVENQDVFGWATSLEPADPPVWGTWDIPAWEVGDRTFQPEKWIREEEPLSRFLLQVVLFEAAFGASEGAAASWLDPKAQEQLVSRLVAVPLGAWHWPDYPTRFYARDDVVAVICPNRVPESSDFVSVTVGGRNPEALAFLEDLVDRSWEYYSPRDGP